jgi:hypothetical protein
MLLPYDKMVHFAGGLVVGGVLLVFREIWPLVEWGPVSIIGTIVIVGVLAVLKELLDRLDPEHHTAEVADVIATMAGGVAGAMIVAILRQYFGAT